MPATTRLTSLVLLAMLGCDDARERAETHRVTLPKTTTLPTITLTVPTFLDRPLSLANANHPNAGYVLAAAEQAGSTNHFAGQVRIESYDGKQPVCDGDWTIDRRNGFEVKSCAAINLTTALIPHAGGEIFCWSQWHAFGDLTLRQRPLADAIDESCATIAVE